jgi:MFS transporter, DHA1 family, multidrug resistance protein
MTSTSTTSASPHFAVLVLLSALSVLPTTIIAPALPSIAAEFSADPAIISWAVAGHAFATAVVQLISGASSDRYGGRPVAIASIIVFIGATVGCAVAPNLAVFLICRTSQAAIATCFAAVLVSIKLTSGESDGASKMGYAAMAWALAPMVAPTLGGLLDQLYGWRSIFAALTLSGLIILVLALRELKKTNSPLARPPESRLSAWFELLKSGRFWAYSLCMTFSMGTFYTFMVGAPIAVGGPGAALGLYMGLVPTGFIVGSFLTGRYARYLQRGTVLIIARGLTCIGLLLGLALATLDFTRPIALFAPCVFIGIGNGLTMPSANMGAMSVRPDLAGTAAGLAAAMSIGGGALVVAASGLFLSNDRERLFSTLLSVALVALLFAMLAALERRATPLEA